VRTRDERYLRMTKFWGKLFLINFAMGVVTGIVQEFQFGMNWSDYSRFVGDVFGAPLAIEAVRRSDAIFDLERTINGLPHEQRHMTRQDNIAPLVADLESWMRGARRKMSR